MSQKSAAFMSPQAAIARGRENSKGARKNPMKLIYNFDAHKKTASEGMFSNPSSEIPDEMWKAPAPMQRQADAVVMWAELTGKHAGVPQPKLSQSALATAKPISTAPPEVQRQLAAAKKFFPKAAYSQDRTTGAIYKLSSAIQKNASGCGSHGASKVKKRLKKATTKEAAGFTPGVEKAIRAVGQNPEVAGALMGAPLGAAHAYSGNRERKGGLSKNEAHLIGRIAAAKAQKADKKKIDSLKARLKAARNKRENIGRTTLVGGAVGAAAGGAAGHLARRGRGK